MTVQVARIFPNALFIKSDYPFHLLWNRYVSEENSNAKIKRSTQTQLQRRIKYPGKLAPALKSVSAASKTS
jgi:hypothetical protein